MKRLALIALFGSLLVGCAEKPEPLAETPEGEQTSAPQTTGGGGDSVGVISPAAGAISPVTNSESVAGGSSGGSGVGQAAKDQARRAASQAGGGSLDQGGDN